MCNSRVLFIIGILLAFQLGPNRAFAQDSEPTGDERHSVEAELEQVRKKIRREEKRLRELKELESQIEHEINEIEKMSAATAKEKVGLGQVISELENEADRLVEAASATKERIAGLKIGLRKRIIALYKMQRRSASVDYLFSSTSTTDLLKRAYYLSRVAGYDNRKIEQLSSEIETFKEDRQKLEEVRAKKNNNFAGLRKLEKQLELRRLQKAELLRKKREKAKQGEKALGKLRDSAEKLESVLARIMGGEEPPPTKPEEKPGEKPEEKPSEVQVVKAVPRPPSEMVVLTPFEGKGLRRLRGSLPFPVEGEIVRGFGKQRHGEFSDMLFIKGLEVIAPVGSKVKAVAKGKVILSKILPGYGNVVILDHGKRYYTLYAKLAGLLCRAGDVVDAGDVLAVVGEADHRGRNFYFELRIRGKATDPKRYFKKIPAARGHAALGSLKSDESKRRVA